VTFALFAYNQEKYIREAIEGAFAQTYDSLEIILSDDYSSDRTFEIIQEMAAAYRGPHEVRVNRTTKNLGLSSHVNEVMPITNGEFIVIAAGDDISLPQRATITVEIFNRFPSAASILFSGVLINEKGEETGYRRVLNTNSDTKLFSLKDFTNGKVPLFGAARSFKREVYNFFGPLNINCPTEDSPFQLRSAMLGGIVCSSKVMIKYRKHGENLSKLSDLGNMKENDIEIQYFNDTKIAINRNLISLTSADQVKSWIFDFGSAKKIRLKVTLGYSILLADLRSAIFIKTLTLREKFGLIKLSIIRPLNDTKK
jgi:glycosyltransferase involved in cell wall biosynthesis